MKVTFKKYVAKDAPSFPTAMLNPLTWFPSRRLWSSAPYTANPLPIKPKRPQGRLRVLPHPYR